MFEQTSNMKDKTQHGNTKSLEEIETMWEVENFKKGGKGDLFNVLRNICESSRQENNAEKTKPLKSPRY